jgi:hypothetical protein
MPFRHCSHMQRLCEQSNAIQALLTHATLMRTKQCHSGIAHTCNAYANKARAQHQRKAPMSHKQCTHRQCHSGIAHTCNADANTARARQERKAPMAHKHNPGGDRTEWGGSVNLWTAKPFRHCLHMQRLCEQRTHATHRRYMHTRSAKQAHAMLPEQHAHMQEHVVHTGNAHI